MCTKKPTNISPTRIWLISRLSSQSSMPGIASRLASARIRRSDRRKATTRISSDNLHHLRGTHAIHDESKHPGRARKQGGESREAQHHDQIDSRRVET